MATGTGEESSQTDVSAKCKSKVIRFTIGACWFQFFISGLYYGLSPFALPISRHFGLGAHDLKGGVLFHGFAILMVVQALTCAVVIFIVDPMSMSRKRAFVHAAYAGWPVGLAFLALGVQLRSVWVMLLLGFPLMGIAIGVQVGYVHMVLTTVMWGPKITIGSAFTGGSSAFGALAWNFVFGETANLLGFDCVNVTFWIFLGVHALGICFGLLFLDPMRHYEPPSYVDVIGSASVSDAQMDKSTSDGVARPLTGAELARDWRVYVFVFVVEAFFFTGLTMKTLMSELFEKILQLEYIHAIRYSGSCLAAYAVCRFVSPLLAFGDYVFLIFVVVLTVEGFAYVLTPLAIDLEEGSGVLYTSFRVVGGMGFAILKSNTQVLLVRCFGRQNSAKISGIFLLTEMVIGLGPSIAFTFHVQQVKDGTSSERSYDYVFYFCTAVVFIANMGTVVLWLSTLHRRAAIARKQTEASGSPSTAAAL